MIFFFLDMLLSFLLLIPIIGVFAILINKDNGLSVTNIKFIALISSIANLLLSLLIFILFDFSTNQFQFVQEYHEISYFDFYLGVDGLSIYFILLTTIIIPISLLSNWTSISKDVESYVIIILLLETLLLAVFLVLDILLFYIFFESILPPLFILIGIFGSDNRVKASFYLFLYTLLGSLFLLLSILAMSSIMSTTDFDTLFKGNFLYVTQLFLFYGIFIAFAVKTPTIFLNTWLLKAHVESPLGGSIILAAIVLKLSLYGILRLILPVLPKAYMEYTYIIYLIGVITIIYASLSTLRTIDVKELIAYSSVSHAAVYLLGIFSNSIQGIEGSIGLGLAHGLVSPGLFICAGGILYDRSSTRLITNYKGVAQVMPLFAILFFILCLGNCGAPLTLNFVGEFMSLYGTFERSSLFGALASSSIIFSAAYTIYMYQRIAFGGTYSRMFTVTIPDVNKREFIVLLTLVVPTVLFGIYTAPILDGVHYSVSTLIYGFDLVGVNNGLC
jgi:NADH-ubiquinone oxidoreductase chain 4